MLTIVSLICHSPPWGLYYRHVFSYLNCFILKKKIIFVVLEMVTNIARNSRCVEMLWKFAYIIMDLIWKLPWEQDRGFVDFRSLSGCPEGPMGLCSMALEGKLSIWIINLKSCQSCPTDLPDLLYSSRINWWAFLIPRPHPQSKVLFLSPYSPLFQNCSLESHTPELWHSSATR